MPSQFASAKACSRQLSRNGLKLSDSPHLAHSETSEAAPSREEQMPWRCFGG
jgi:hypothetical protein